jgi:hypothetical protein
MSAWPVVRTRRLEEIHAALDGRPVAWFGTRGIDALPMLALGRLGLVASQMAAIGDSALVEQEFCLEARVGMRYDLDKYDIDADYAPQAVSFRRGIGEAVRARMAIVAYRPADFLAGPTFCEIELLTAFNFTVFQRQFEHKPWVERALSAVNAGVVLLKTRYVRDNDYKLVGDLVQHGPMVGRTSRSSGGAGVFLFATVNEFVENMPAHGDGFVSATPYLADAIPLNVNGCVYASGEVRGFAASYQLIGVAGLTDRRFGFCGNDFARAAELDDEVLLAIERAVQGVGQWLAKMGYRGVFGLDLMWSQGQLYLAELNARFQASTALASRLCQGCGRPDPTTEHLAAFLDLPAPGDVDVLTQTRATATAEGPRAQVLHRNNRRDNMVLTRVPEPVAGVTFEAVAPVDMPVDRHGLFLRSMHRDAITQSGYDVSPATLAIGAALKIGY